MSFDSVCILLDHRKGVTDSQCLQTCNSTKHDQRSFVYTETELKYVNGSFYQQMLGEFELIVTGYLNWLGNRATLNAEATACGGGKALKKTFRETRTASV